MNINIENQLVSVTTKILIFIRNNPGCRISDLRDNIINPRNGKTILFQHVSMILVHLEQKDLITRRKETVSICSYLTDKGEKLLNSTPEEILGLIK